MPSFAKLASENLSAENQDPQFKCGEIVYLFDWAEDGRSSHEWPVVGSRYEVDLKIIDFFSEKIGLTDSSGNTFNKWFYNAISGRGYHINAIPESHLIKPSEKQLMYGDLILVLKTDTEYAKAGTRLNRQGDYWMNDELGIYLSNNLINELKTSGLFEDKNK